MVARRPLGGASGRNGNRRSISGRCVLRASLLRQPKSWRKLRAAAYAPQLLLKGHSITLARAAQRSARYHRPFDVCHPPLITLHLITKVGSISVNFGKVNASNRSGTNETEHYCV